jgi:hypothetical protein
MGVSKDRPVLIAVIGATSAIVAAFSKPICSALFSDEDKPKAAAVAGVEPITPTPGEPTIEGAWKQYVFVPEEGPVYLGTFVVSKFRGDYVVSPRAQEEGERYVNTLGVFDINYTGQQWSFNSNWGGGEVGNFELKRVSPTVFEGEIRVAGQLSNRTRFVKIE